MILRYKYFNNIVDHENELKNLSKDKIKYISNKKLEELTGMFSESIIKYNTKYKEIPLVIKPGFTNIYEVSFYFTEEEYKEIKQENPSFAEILFSFKDRLAINEKGELYDIDENQPKEFQWHSFYLEY